MCGLWRLVTVLIFSIRTKPNIRASTDSVLPLLVQGSSAICRKIPTMQWEEPSHRGQIGWSCLQMLCSVGVGERSAGGKVVKSGGEKELRKHEWGSHKFGLRWTVCWPQDRGTLQLAAVVVRVLYLWIFSKNNVKEVKKWHSQDMTSQSFAKHESRSGHPPNQKSFHLLLNLHNILKQKGIVLLPLRSASSRR